VISTVPVKIVATTVALLIAGAAAAAAAMDSPPPAADKGLTNAEEHTGFPVPVANGRGDDEAPGDDAVEDEGDESEEAPDDATDESADDAAPKDNHGAYVSAVAQDKTLTGREHGEAVSEVARSDAGKPDHGDDEDEADDAEDEDEGQPGQGNGQGKGHNK